MQEKNKDVPGEVLLAKDFILEKLLGIFHNNESTKAKMLETNPSIEKTKTIRQGDGKDAPPHHVIQQEGKHSSSYF